MSASECTLQHFQQSLCESVTAVWAECPTMDSLDTLCFSGVATAKMASGSYLMPCCNVPFARAFAPMPTLPLKPAGR